MNYVNRKISSLIIVVLLVTACKNESKHNPIGPVEFAVETVTDSIEVPFGMEFLPNGTMLVSNRIQGSILMVNTEDGSKKTLKGVPDSYCMVDGGALDILLHPDFNSNNLLYYAHSIGDSTASTLAIERAELVGDSLQNIRRIFTALPYYKDPSHYGTRMQLRDGYLYFTMGERFFLSDSAQTLSNHLGKVMRIYEDGSIPEDNPFIYTEGALPEIWSYGHRNPQGLAFHPDTNELWMHEHGPKGGDEVNLVRPGKNYGWPLVCFGVNYDGTPVGDGKSEGEGLEPPLYHYTPSIAPSGMIFYTGDSFPQWKGDLLIGALALRHMNRLDLENGKIVAEERLLEDLEKRIRVIKEGPDGNLYLGVDGGSILRIKPKKIEGSTALNQ